MQNSNQIASVALVVFGCILAIIVGNSIGSDDPATAVTVIGTGLAIGVALKLGSHSWILLPVFWFWTGNMLLLRVPFSIRNMVTIFVVVVTVISTPLGGFKWRMKPGLLDALVVLMMAHIGVVFALNPVGLASMASESVGARPYFEIGMALIAYIIVSNQMIDAGRARLLCKYVLVSAFVLAVGRILSVYTSLGFKLIYLYSDWAPDLSALGAVVDPNDVGRVSHYAQFGVFLLTYLYSTAPPLRCLNPMNVIRCSAFLLALAGILVSGFRNIVVQVAMLFLIATYIWGRAKAVMVATMIGIVGYVGLVAVNEIVPLPLPVQRAVSFLPGNWNDLAVRDAKGSSEWRFEMWKDALMTDKVISNKVMGDGFGFKSREINLLQRARVGGDAGEFYETHHEHMQLVGGFHSGPISSIRFVGVIGLIIYLTLAISLAVVAFRTMKSARGTPFMAPSIFFGVSWIGYPLFFVAIFGAFDADLPNTLFAVGMINMLRNSMRASKGAEPAPVVPEVLPTPDAPPGTADGRKTPLRPIRPRG